MLDLSAFMSRMLSSAVALFRLTMSATTPGCGIRAMSGVSSDWIFVMMTWLMLSIFCQFTVMPLPAPAAQPGLQAVDDGLVHAQSRS
jgi:uncharacterized RDD family membrane protein YckC